MNEKSALIEAEKDNYPVMWMCHQLDVARSSFYAWRARVGTLSAAQARRAALKDEVARVFTGQRGTAGCRRIAAELNQEGIACSVGLVADLMRELGLAAIQPRAWRRTTIRGTDAQVFTDLLDGDFDPVSVGAGQRLVGDITYLRTGAGWVYLAVVLDLATRMVVDWQMANHMRTSLVIDALKMARTHGYAADEAIFHSDHGTQYSSEEFGRFCADNGFVQSMGRTGVCWDNAAAESFFSSLKNEMYHHQVFTTREAARLAVADYIETFYNRRRRHSTINYRTPAQAWADRTAATHALAA